MPNKTTKRINLPVVGSFREDPILKVDSQRTINMYEVFDKEGKKPDYLSPWPGLKAEYQASEGANGRASIAIKGFAYFVIRQDVYRLDPALTFTRISDNVNRFATLTGHVGIAANESQVAFVDGNRLLIWDYVALTFTDVTANLPAGVVPLDITFMDGYFILVNGATTNQNRFYISKLDDGTIWPINDFVLVNSRPTTLSACSTLHRRVFLFGEINSEVWLDAGQADFPFRRDNNLLLEHGVIARASIDEGFGVMLYLANDQDGVGGVMMVSGVTPKKVSTREVDQVIQKMDDVSDATGNIFKINGQIFYMISFTSGERTFLYNISNDRWYELEALDGTRYIANSHSFYQDKHFVTGYNDDLVYEMNENFFDIDRSLVSIPFERIKRTRITRVFSSPIYNRMRLSRVHIDMLQGLGLSNVVPSDPDYDPVVFLSISEDGGVTYHNFERQPIGPSGQRLVRTIWRQLGIRRDAILKFEMFGRAPYHILGGAADIMEEPE